MFYILRNKNGNLTSYLRIHWLKVTFMSLYFIMFILYLIDLWKDFLPGTMDTMLATVSLIVSAAIFFYNEINFIFVLFNKIKISCKNPTVFWTATSTIYSDNEELFKERNSTFISNLREKGEIQNINIDQNDQNLFKITITNKREMNIFIVRQYINTYDDDYKITFKYSSNMSYKESKDEYDYFLKLVNIYSYSLSKKEKVEEYTDQGLIPSYTLTVEFKDYNPYYSVLMKNINSEKIKSFRLNFSVNGADIKIIDNKLTVTSKEEEKIRKISNDYIAISSK